MKRGGVRRLGVSGVLLLCVLVLVTSASADETTSVSIAAEPASVSEGADATFTVTRSGDLLLPSAVSYSTVNESAAAGTDYTAESGILEFLPNEASKTITVATQGNSLDEADRTFKVALTEPVVNTSIGNAEATVTVADDDDPPTVSVTAGPSVTEGGGPVTFTVSLSERSKKAVAVSWETVNGSASAGSDYTGASGRLTWAPREDAAKTISVAVLNDTLDEPTENFTVRLSAPDDLKIGTGSATGTIEDNDEPPSIASISDPTVTEGNAGSVNARFVVTLSGASGKEVTVQYATAEGTATVANNDFSPRNGTLTFPAGATSGTIDVPVTGDTVPEPDENFFLNLFGASNAGSISDAQGRATITNDDTPPSVQSISDPTVTEGHSGNVEAKFVVTLSGNAPGAVAVRYSTLDGTAKSPEDYEGASNQTLTIPAGSREGTITINVKGDRLPEGNENFFVDLLSATGATLGSDTRGVGTITDDDPAPTISITGGEVTEGDGGTVSLNFRVRLSGTTTQRVLVTAVTQDGSAVAPTDYQAKTQVLDWAPNTNELEKTFTVLVNGDALDEPSETMLVTLSSPDKATIAAGQATGTIRDNDNRSQLAISDAEANEGSAGATSTMTFKVTLAPASARGVSVAYATADGTATAGADYTAKSGSVSFAPGETEKTIEIAVLGDDVNEENETVRVNLGSPAGAAVADTQGQGVIVDRNAPPSLSINDVAAREGEGATFTVTLAGTTLRAVTVTFSTAEGTAKEGSDYAPRRGTLTFAPGEKTKTVAVTVLDDPLEESPETFSVSLGDPVNATIVKRSGTATIEASDLSTGVTPAGGGLNSGTGGLNNRPLPVTPKAPTGKNTTKVLLPRIVLGPRIVTLRSRQARMLVTCMKNSPIVCAGSIEFETATKPTFKLGKKAFSVKKGKKALVPISLSPKGIKLLQKTGKLQVKVIVYVKSSAKKSIKVQPGVITVKVAKAAAKSSAP